MASSIRRLISDNASAAAASCLRRPRISLSQTRGCSKLSGGGDSSLPRVSSPSLMLPPTFGGGGGMSYNFYSLAQNKVVSLNKMSGSDSAESPNDDALFVGSSRGWLALHNQRGDRGLFLSNPVTGENIKLPPLHSGDDVEKVILSHDPHDEQCSAVATLNGARLAFCSPGRSSRWTSRITGSRPYRDLTYSTAEGLVFCVRNAVDRITYGDEEEMEEMEAWIASDPSSPRIYCMDRLYGGSQPWRRSVPHLVYVEDLDKLLLVRRHVDNKYPNKTVGFMVYVIEGYCLRPIRKTSLSKGLVVFVGPNHSFAVWGSHFPELKPGSVYFTDSLLGVSWRCPWLDEDDDVCRGHDIGIFDLRKQTISYCNYPCDHGSLKSIHPPPFWFPPSPLY